MTESDLTFYQNHLSYYKRNRLKEAREEARIWVKNLFK